MGEEAVAAAGVAVLLWNARSLKREHVVEGTEQKADEQQHGRPVGIFCEQDEDGNTEQDVPEGHRTAEAKCPGAAFRAAAAQVGKQEDQFNGGEGRENDNVQVRSSSTCSRPVAMMEVTCSSARE